MRRKGLAYLMTAVMIFGMLLGVPATSKKVEAATTTCGGLNVAGGELGKDFSYDSTNGRVVVMTSTALTFTSTSSANTTGIYVNKDVDANITLDGVYMRFKTAGVYAKPGIEIADDSTGDVKIYIDNKTRIYCQAAPAIQKNGVSGSLTIDATERAKSDYTNHFLFAKTDGYYVENSNVVSGCAAIGGSTGKDSGNITIKNGMIYAVSSSMGAAIGGGANGDGTDISVTGGKVYALVGNTIDTSNMYTGAAIGGGYQGNGESITITGGEVLARFYENGETNGDWIVTQKGYSSIGGAGIGGGYNGSASDITISGGTVTAMGDMQNGSAGIGAGELGNATGIQITGGIINATGGAYGAGIGSGKQAEPSSYANIPNTDITITGGTIVATGGTDAPGIGAGSNANVFVRIGGGSVYATAGGTSADKVGFGKSQNSSTGYDFVKNVIAKESEKDTNADVVSIEEKKTQFTDKNTDVSGRLEFKYTNGTAYTDYITNGMVTDANGYVYPYLPSDVTASEKNEDGELIILYNGAALKSCYNQPVSISANGYTVSRSSTSGFASTCTLSTSGTYTLYFKGNVSNKVTTKSVTVNIDMTAPTGLISLDGKDYSTVNGVASTQKYTLSNNWVTIHCYDDDKKSVQYALADTYYSESNIESNVSWNTYNSPFEFPSNAAKAIYVKLTDTIGNVKYLSTPVIYNDTTAPTNTASKSSVSADSATVSMSVKDSNNIEGITRQYAYVVLPKGEAAPTDWASLVNKITSNNGGQGSLNDDTTFNKTFTGLTANTTYKLYMMSKNALTNLKGTPVENVSDVTSIEFTTSRLTASASNQSLQVKQALAGTDYQYDLKKLLSSTVASNLLNPSYTCTVESGSVVNATGKLNVSDNGVVTIPFKSNLSAGATQELQVSITSDNYETISGKLTIEITSKTSLELSGVSVAEVSTYQQGVAHGYTGNIQWMSNGQCLVDASGTDILYTSLDGYGYSSSEAPTDAGTYQVTFSIKNSNADYVGTRSYTFEIKKASLRNEMSNVSWYLDNTTKISANNYSVLLDGNNHTVSVKGYSDKVAVNYGGDYSKNAIGNYTAIANFTVKNEYARNYDLPSDLSQMTLTWKIADKITPDMSQVSWVYEQGSTQSSYIENETKLTENGNTYTVKVVGVPEGVEASYTGTCSAKEAGTYQAKVEFTVSDTTKYHTPNPSTKTLTWKIATAPSTDDDNGGSTSGGTGDSDKEETGGTTGENTSGTTTEDNNTNSNVPVPTVGSTKEIDGGQYKVTTSSVTGGTVAYTGPVDKKNASKVKIPATITIDNQTYKVTSIAKGAFSGCKKLSKVTIPNGIITIGANAFKGCVKLSTVSIPNSVESIGANAFSGCKKLKTVTLKSGSKLKTIGDKAFYKCVVLTKITIPKNVTTIGKSAFYGCKKLKTITIKSKKLKKVGTKAIKGIHKRATIKCPGKKYVTKYKKLFKSKTGYKKSMKLKK